MSCVDDKLARGANHQALNAYAFKHLFRLQTKNTFQSPPMRHWSHIKSKTCMGLTLMSCVKGHHLNCLACGFHAWFVHSICISNHPRFACPSDQSVWSSFSCFLLEQSVTIWLVEVIKKSECSRYSMCIYNNTGINRWIRNRCSLRVLKVVDLKKINIYFSFYCTDSYFLLPHVI